MSDVTFTSTRYAPVFRSRANPAVTFVSQDVSARGPAGAQGDPGPGGGGGGTGGIPVAVRFDSPDWIATFRGTVGAGVATVAALAAGVPAGDDIWLDGASFGADEGFYRHAGAGVFVLADATQWLDGLAYTGLTIGVVADFGEVPRTEGSPDSTSWLVASDGVNTYARKQSVVPQELAAKLTVGTTIYVAADGATLSGSEHAVGAIGATLTLADAESFGHGQDVAIAAAAGNLVLAAAGADLLNSGAGLTILSGGTATLRAVDLAPFGLPFWNWQVVGGTGPQFNVPAWVGDGLTDDRVLLRTAGGTPAWSPPPAAIDIGRVYNVRDYGAVGDGTTDDTDAFEAACDAAFLLPGVILVPAVDRDAGERYLVRRRIVIPSWTTIRGQGQGSVITKATTFGATAPGAVSAGANTITVDDASGFAVGDELTVSDIGNMEWNSTHAVVADVTGLTLTLDRPLISSYTDASVLTVFPLVSNNIGHTNSAAASTHGARVESLVLDHHHGGGDFTDDTYIDFTNSTIHWEHAFDHVVHDVHILNAAGDAYSDQYRGPDGTPGYGFPTSNAIIGSHIHNGVRHGIHIGSDTASAQIVGNRVQDCDYMGVFLCRFAQNTVITGNTFVNCRAGVSGSDTRQTDDGPVTDLTPYGDIRGDIGTVVTGNTFLGGPLSDTANTLPAIDLAAQGVAVGNTIMDWNGGIRVTVDSVDCTVTGNSITLGPNYSSGGGVSVLAGAHRCSIVGNTIRGGGHGNETTVKQDTGILIETADDCTIIGNHLAELAGGVSLAGDFSNLTMAHNTATDITDGFGLVRIYGTLTDCSLDVTSFDPSGDVISYYDNAAGSAAAGAAAQVRLLVNGTGDNGASDPASAGDWFTITGQRYDGVIVKWNNGEQRASQYHYDHGWIALGAGAPPTDETDWHLIYDQRLSAPGAFGEPGDAGFVYTDADLTTYDEIRVRLVGRGASTAASSVGVRLRWNGDVGSNYLISTTALATTAWNNNGIMPSSLTNTNRRGLWEAVIALGHTTDWTIADWSNVYVTSNAAAGSAKGQGSLYYTNLGAALGSFELYDSAGAGWAAGARLTVWGRKLPA